MIYMLRGLKIVFIGTPEFGAIILDKLCQSEYKPVLVATSLDKPVGRKQVITPSPVKMTAEKYKIPVAQPENIKDIKSEIQNLKPDLVVVAAYSQLIPKDILEIPSFGFLNVHPSLLPKYRGPSPIQYAILNGDEEAGVTIMLMDEKLDSGKIVSLSRLSISEEITAEQLTEKTADLGAKLLLNIIPKWINNEIEPNSQDEKRATYTKILKKEDGKVDWQKPVEEIERKVRAFSLWPGTYTFWQNKGKTVKIKILKTRVYKSSQQKRYDIGKVLVVPQNEIGVQCKEDFLVIEKLQIEGKKESNAEEFLRGHSDFAGSTLE